MLTKFQLNNLNTRENPHHLMYAHWLKPLCQVGIGNLVQIQREPLLQVKVLEEAFLELIVTHSSLQE
jgi:hypothetical protein